MSRTALILLLALLTVLVGHSGGDARDAKAAGGHRTLELELVRAFDPALLEFPKGIAFDRDGNVYFGMQLLAQVRKIAPDGTETTIAQLPISGPIGTSLLSAVAVVEHGSRGDTVVYAAFGEFYGSNGGVYAIDSVGNITRIPGSEAILGNGMAVDRDDNVYVADSVAGAIWRISPDAQAAELWIQAPLLEGDGLLPGFEGLPLGVGAMTVEGRSLLVTVEEKSRVVRIAINKDGSAGNLSVVVEDPSLYMTEGVAVAPNGTMFISSWINSTLSMLDRDGNLEVVADSGDGLLGPVTISFGKGPLSRYLYIVNASSFIFSDPHPALYRIDVNR